MPAPCPLVLDDPDRVGLLGAELVANRLRARAGLRLLLPTGRTPEGMYAALRAHAADRSLPTEQALALVPRAVDHVEQVVGSPLTRE